MAKREIVKLNERNSSSLPDCPTMNCAEVLQGCVGRIWLARRRTEVESGKKEPCDFVDDWPGRSRVEEGKPYHNAHGHINGIAKLYSCEKVSIGNESDSTRQDLEHIASKSINIEAVVNYPPPLNIEGVAPLSTGACNETGMPLIL
ncbi:hypothetical protein ABKN59_012068 [Abortiporus biennis]